MNYFFIFLLPTIIFSLPCSAIVGDYYQTCYSSARYSGSKYSGIKYTVSVIGVEKLECKVLGYSKYDTESICNWEFQNVGFMSNRSVDLIWDQHNSYAAIQCKSTTKNTSFEWDWKPFQGTLTCQQRSFQQLFLKNQ